MGIMKNLGRPELKYKYRRVFSLSLILSLVLMITAFKFFPHIESEIIEYEVPQELFTVENIQQTIQNRPPPPPPDKPVMIIEAAIFDDIQDIELGDTEIGFNDDLSAPPPLPQKKQVTYTEEIEPVYFVAVEEMPYPIGGVSEIQRRIVYPELAQRAGVEGKVYILAYVDREGRVTKTEVIKGIGGGCDEVAAEAVKKTSFSPGKQRGKPVYVKVMIPIRFELNDKPS